MEVDDRLIAENYFSTVSAVAIGAYIGAFIRMGLDELMVNFAPVVVFPSLYSQIFGCAMMGVSLHFMTNIKSKFLPLYALLTTGAAGSITSFSSWNQHASLNLTGLDNMNFSVAEKIFTWLTVLMVGLGMPAMGLHFGKHIGVCISHIFSIRPVEIMYSHSSWNFRTLTTAEKILIGSAIFLICFMTAVVITLGNLRPDIPELEIPLSLFFAPIGAILRYFFSFLNKKNPYFPIGTFCVNILGTIALGLAGLVPYIFTMGRFDCSFWNSIATGFCGCFTTVSTFQVELHDLKLRNSYIYGFASVLIAQVCLIAINGGFAWSRTPPYESFCPQ